ncbi:MAG: Zn-ribbon domain-containing OB-fold protein [Acidimicrobiales bacterium]
MSASGEAAAPPFRVLPRVVPGENEYFWRSGEDGRLRFLRCKNDHYLVHPPSPRCPKCLSKDLEPWPVSGRATVLSYTINYQAWIPGFDPPYALAIVEIDEQSDVRLFTNIVNCPVEDVRIGMPVRVTFEHNADVWVPLFEPA